MSSEFSGFSFLYFVADAAEHRPECQIVWSPSSDFAVCCVITCLSFLPFSPFAVPFLLFCFFGYLFLLVLVFSFCSSIWVDCFGYGFVSLHLWFSRLGWFKIVSLRVSSLNWVSITVSSGLVLVHEFLLQFLQDWFLCMNLWGWCSFLSCNS